MLRKKRLFIVGAGSLGRQFEHWLTWSPPQGRDWEIAGYLDNNKNALDGFPSDYQIVGAPDSFEFDTNDLCALTIADPENKEKVYYQLKGKVTFYTYISPYAAIGRFTEIGEGSMVFHNSVLTTNITIGTCVFLNCSTQVGHDVQIGEFTSIMSRTDIGGGCIIGKKVYMGLGVTVIPQRKIHDKAKIGAGSVVIKNIKEATAVFGNPATVIV